MLFDKEIKLNINGIIFNFMSPVSFTNEDKELLVEIINSKSSYLDNLIILSNHRFTYFCDLFVWNYLLFISHEFIGKKE